MQYDNYLFCYFHSENYLVWTNKVLFDSGYLVTIKWLAHLHISVLYCSRLSFFQAHSFQIMCEASRGVPLSPLSPRSPFWPGEPWIPGSPFAPFFPSAPLGPWVPFFPGLPSSPLAPSRPGAPVAPGTHVMYVHIPVCPLLQDGSGC